MSYSQNSPYWGGGGVVLAQNMGPSAVTGFVLNVAGARTAVCNVETFFFAIKMYLFGGGGNN
jgi:hypothetical protein